MSYSPTFPSDFSGSIGQAQNNVFTFTNTNGHAGIAFRLVPPTGATVVFESSFDGGINWNPCTMRGATVEGYGQTANVTDVFLGSIAGMTHFRVRTSVGGSAPGSITGRAVPQAHTLEGIENPAPSDFLINMARGRIENSSGNHKFGRNPDIDTGADETIWGAGGIYPYSGVAETWYAMSTNAGDGASVQVQMQSLDGNYVQQNVTVNLNGQTPVAFSGTHLRVNRAFISGATEAAGTVYIARSNVATNGVPNSAADIRSLIDPVDQQTTSTGFTVPAGSTAYFLGYEAEASTGNVDLKLKVREFGKVFRTRSRKNVNAGSQVKVDYGTYLKIPEKSDVEFRGASSVNNTVCSVDYDLILIATVDP